ncbi:hypothetical protein N7516_000326 [Penicillium verrucosum]|uniref:uncharacterized protein n=1 Tax=Penicillium verrucosum TaxID=60171 RepID=UPI0025450F38|nr:uncharacterized protein N7516_000326 [Penicillium verrucosum]KAJ5940158.1 hypothetical protein N7516_000326 [Penicillium verrucosum]
MARISKRSKSSSMEKKLLRQKRDRRKSCLEKKAKMCGADVCLGIRIRQSGKVFIFSADASGFWSFLSSQLVGMGDYKFSDSFRALTIQGQLKGMKRASTRNSLMNQFELFWRSGKGGLAAI